MRSPQVHGGILKERKRRMDATFRSVDAITQPMEVREEPPPYRKKVE
jgi:hypothetical protein